MNQKNWLETSSIYLNKNSRFYLWILYPVILFFILLAIFLVFGTQEIVVRTTAELTAPSKSTIQVPLGTQIIENNLTENKIVKEGDLLIVLDTSELTGEINQLQKENETIEAQITAANTFVDSVNQGIDLFENDDEFGYSNQFQSMLSEKASTTYLSEEAKEIANKNLQEYQNANSQLSKQITEHESNINEWEKVKVSWSQSQTANSTSKDIISTVQLWQTQLISTPEENRENFINTVLTSIQENITQLKNELEQLNNDQAKLILPTTSDNQIKSKEAEIIQSHEQVLSTIKQKMSELTALKQKNEISIQNLKNKQEQSHIKAPINGVVHINEEVKNNILVQEGTILAEVYPPIRTEKIYFTTSIPSNKISNIKKNMEVTFKVDENRLTKKFIHGKLTTISEATTTNEQGTYYTCTGFLKPTENFNERYGLTGELSLIVGKKTYFNQIKEVILN